MRGTQQRRKQQRHNKMALKDNYINILINIFRGVAWATVLFFFVSGLIVTYGNIITKLISGVISSLFGLFLVLLIEFINAGFVRYVEQKKTNELLEDILKEIKGNKLERDTTSKKEEIFKEKKDI